MSDLAERYANLVRTGVEYAKIEKQGAPVSTFEIYMGHFSRIGEEYDAEIKRVHELNKAMLVALKEATEFANMANRYIAGQDLSASTRWLSVIAKAEGHTND